MASLQQQPFHSKPLTINSEPPTRNLSSSSLTGSYISNAMHGRRPSLTAPQAGQSKNLEDSLRRARKNSSQLQISIPMRREDIDPRWAAVVVNQYKCKHAAVFAPDMTVYAEDIVQCKVTDCKTGVGDFSSTYKMDVLVKKDGCDLEQHSFVAKLIPADDPGRVYVFEAKLFEKEICAYFELLPALKDFVEGQTRRPEDTPIDRCVPEVVYGSHNLDGAGALVFRSCAADGFAHSSNPDGLSLEEACVVVRNLAEFHAVGHAFIRKHDEDRCRMRYHFLTEDMYSTGLLLRETTLQLQTYHEFLHAIPGERELAQRFDALRSDHKVAFDLLKGLRRSGPPALTTIIHGECWEKNIMLNGDRCMFIDWKFAKIASGTIDLAFFLLSSTSHSLRQDRLHQILRVYHESFISTLRTLGVSCCEPSLADITADYKESVKHAVLQAVCLFSEQMQFLEEAISMSAADPDPSELEKQRAYERRAIELMMDVESPPVTPSGSMSPAIEEEEEQITFNID